ncbi:hypothetical protein LAZ40_09745 [Cereibacter sphaeroides]|uniref:hypothetical protein n=1 Tax=Cereibacter sphaeroides TaxID=1063 RepID=UPI001F272B40|nr:hypothetical protein [Cereibacter sphaeroides]MCE6959333.1 hypothetical protein [Cereibacter sphaeroides]MCE6972925.1 hypothetical protein [Cereibacter sphaeroides]
MSSEDEPGILPEQERVDEEALARFTEALRAKLARSRAKGRDGWHRPDLCPERRLADMLAGHLMKGNEGTFLDIATFAMMLHERGADPMLLRTALAGAMPDLEPWRPIDEAPKNGTVIWARFRDDLSATTGREDLIGWDGVQIPLRHPGILEDGRDLGWNVAAPVGHGGFPDRWIAGWVPLRGAGAPSPSLPRTPATSAFQLADAMGAEDSISLLVEARPDQMILTAPDGRTVAVELVKGALRALGYNETSESPAWLSIRPAEPIEVDLHDHLANACNPEEPEGSAS